jgi:hypothetical protein
MAERETNQRERPPAASPKLKNGGIFRHFSLRFSEEAGTLFRE